MQVRVPESFLIVCLAVGLLGATTSNADAGYGSCYEAQPICIQGHPICLCNLQQYCLWACR